jgi:hypothetical protein
MTLLKASKMTLLLIHKYQSGGLATFSIRIRRMTWRISARQRQLSYLIERNGGPDR